MVLVVEVVATAEAEAVVVVGWPLFRPDGSIVGEEKSPHQIWQSFPKVMIH